jgi:hypothetical protein
MTNIKAFFGLLVAAVAAGAFAVASSAENTGSSPRSGQLHVTKNCRDYTARRRFVLHDHVLEPQRDQGRLEGRLCLGCRRPDSRPAGQ